MAKDLFGGRTTMELEELNGYVLNLARRTGFPTPTNETIYGVAKERFGSRFQPMIETELLTAIQNKLQK